MSKPKISVLMPIYKTNETHLRAAIKSILNQTFKDFEFLILNDSPDSKYLDKIVSSFNDKRIKYVKNKKNMGITPSRNKLLDIAKGEYIAVMDHDDISLPERFEKQVGFLDKNKDYGVVGSFYKKIGTDKIKKFPIEDIDIKITLLKDCAVWHPTSMIRKKVLIDNSIRYEEAFSPAEDHRLWSCLIKHTKFYNINKPLFEYRLHETNTTKTQLRKLENAGFNLCTIIRNENSDIYSNYLLKTERLKSFKLFGIIPLVTIITKRELIKIKLFKFLLIFSVDGIHKRKIKLFGLLPIIYIKEKFKIKY